MRTDSVQVELRPRGGFEAIDLGLAMVRAWWRPLASTWIALVLPVGVGLVLLLREHPFWAITLLWWLRPVFGRIPLHVLSRKLFGEEAGLRSTTAALPELARSGLGVSLITQRLSPARTFLQPVLQLEGLRGSARRERATILARKDVGAAMGLMAVGAHMNGSLLIGLPLLVGILVPEEVAWRVGSLFGLIFEGTGGAAGGIGLCLLYLVGISFIEPLLVAGGFALYINRRIFLEGWDIDLAFRRLSARGDSSQRARSGVAAASLALALGLVGAAGVSRAADPVCDPAIASSAGGCIEQILKSGDFPGSEERSVWLPREFDGPDVDLQAPAWIAESVAAVFQVAGWLLLGGAVIALAVAVARRVEPPSLDVQVAQARPTTLFGLDLDPAALPEDLLGAARRAWSEGHAIEAMSLLYRGALIRLVDRHGVAIPESATEFECLALVSERDASLPSQRFAELTQAWVGARYAASPPSDAEFDGLCRAFDHAFGATP